MGDFPSLKVLGHFAPVLMTWICVSHFKLFYSGTLAQEWAVVGKEGGSEICVCQQLLSC